MDDFKKLQQRINHDSIQYQFRSKLIGGLNQDDVTEYIEFIESKFHKLEDENKRELEEIFSLRTKLSNEIEEKNNLLKIKMKYSVI
jgi:cell division septum initiation protein DivIVA